MGTMKENDGIKATVDGKEVEVEILSGDDKSGKNRYQRHKRPVKNNVFWGVTGWLPLILFFVILTGIIVLSVRLFIWMLPVLIPLFAVILLFRLIKGAMR